MNSKHFWLLLLILIIAGFFRLYHITTVPPGLYPDEAIGGNQGLEAVRTGQFKLFYPENNGRAGLFINLQGISAALFGATEPWTLRFPSALFGILTVLGVYFLAKELFEENHKYQASNHKQITNSNFESPKTFGIWDLGFGISRSQKIALLSSFFLATSFWHINFSRIGFDGIAAPFFLTWAVYLLLKALNSPNSRFYFLFSIFSGLLYGLGFHTYIAYRITPVLILFILAYYIKTSWHNSVLRKRILFSIFYFLFSSFIVALPMGIYFQTHPGSFSSRTSEISIFSSAHPLKDLTSNILKTLAMFNFRGDGNWRHNYLGMSELFWPVGALFILGIIIGIKSIVNTKHQAPNYKQYSNDKNNKTFLISDFGNLNLFGIWNLEFGILFLWFALGAAPAVFSDDGIPHALRSILMIIPATIFAAIGGISLYESIATKLRNHTKIRKILPATALVFLAFIAIEAYATYFAAWAKNPNTAGAFNADYVQLGQTLNQLPASAPKYVVVEAGGVLVNGPPAKTSSGEVGQGIPMPAQTVMFVTDTYTPENQSVKNIHYILPNQENSIPKGAEIFHLR